MTWNIDFISENNFRNHVRDTISHYGEKLEAYDIKKFNSNLIDPVKMVFDKAVYGASWKEIISNEIFRQRDKAATNEIGYFHQRLFDYIPHCHVPPNGHEGGWDVIYEVSGGYILGNGNLVHRIYVEMKNKHNTMNSSAAGKTYIKMQNQLLRDDDCACYLVEAIAKRSQDVVWKTTVDKQKVSHARIRRASIDKFYEIVTGEPDAFFKICMALPDVVSSVLDSHGERIKIPHDTVYEELLTKANGIKGVDGAEAIYLSLYLLGFGTYNGFSSCANAPGS